MKTVTIRIPDELLLESTTVFEQLGLDLPTAFRVFLTKVAATRSIPFELKAPDLVWEDVPVDPKTQQKMDSLATLWIEKQR
jgi:addiction module RelB/DinJ family antitoxin